jgi:hypothetical protein
MNLTEAMHHSLFDFMDPDTTCMIQKRMESCSLLAPVFESEFEFNLPSGMKRWYHWISRMIADDEGRIVEFQGLGGISPIENRLNVSCTLKVMQWIHPLFPSHFSLSMV